MTNIATLEKPISALAIQLNEALKTQPKENPLDKLDRCDRCVAAAQSVFTYKRGTLSLCGRDMRKHLVSILASNVVSYWISPAELWHIRGVGAAKQDFTKAGDGLTDA